MDDRELLEMAAKAAAIGGGWGDTIEYHNGAVDLRDVWILEGDDFVPWNPLTDDGDALRLAFALGMSVDAGACIINFCVPDAEDDDLEQERELEFDNHDGDIAKLRRAIVRAAASIGEALCRTDGQRHQSSGATNAASQKSAQQPRSGGQCDG